MPKYYEVNDSIVGERIYCTFEKIMGHGVINTGKKSKDKGQYQKLRGNPTIAIITKKLRRIK